MRKSVLAALLLLTCSPAFAAFQRTFVASTGSDTNDCSRQAPCRNFAAAIAQAATGAEVVALDSAGYGPIGSIDKSISIVAPQGVHAALTAFSGQAIAINSPGSSIVLRNLFLTGLGAGFGITVDDAQSVTMDHLWISGFPSGVLFNPAGQSALVISDTVIRKSSGDAASLSAGGPFSNTVTILRSRFEQNNGGVAAFPGANVAVKDTAMVNNVTGVRAFSSASSSVFVVLENCVLNGNFYGIQASESASSNTVIRVSNSTITFNEFGLLVDGAGAADILSRENNTFEDNITPGSFTGTYTAK